MSLDNDVIMMSLNNDVMFSQARFSQSIGTRYMYTLMSLINAE